MKNCSYLAVLLVLLLGCMQRDGESPIRGDESNLAQSVVYDSEWNDRNRDIYRFLLTTLAKPELDRIYFVTTTPMAEWGAAGNWATIPEDELKATPHGSLYRPANEACIKDDYVVEKDSDAKAWMQWISVKRWINENVVEVENGVWSGPLGGGAALITYEKIDGQWRVKEYGRAWTS